MKEEENKLENSLMIPEKPSVFTRFFKWIRKLFSPKDTWTEGMILEQAPSITIPKAVKKPIPADAPMELDENSLEYLYQLSDEELDHLNDLYDAQMEEAKNEISRLDNILQAYQKSIKKLQGQIAEEN